MALDSFGLTLMQRLFCDHYVRNNGNATQAAIAAGYSKETSAEMGCENLRKPHVKKYIGDRVKEAAEKLGLTGEYLFEKLKKGIELSIPSDEKLTLILNQEDLNSKEKIEIISKMKDVRGGVACISEINKMLSNYAPEKHAVLVEEDKTGKVTEMVKGYEKDF